MPRIPPEVIEEIKSVANIVEVISDYLPLKKVGKNYVALCPFHQEDTPSFTVSEEKQIFHCFGCGVGGNVFNFLMKYKDCSFYEAVEEVATRYGIDISKFKAAAQDPHYSQTKALYELNKLARDFFHHNLLENRDAKVARDYFFNRGIKEETIKAYHLGYATASWDGLTSFLKKKGMDLNLATMAGLVVSNPSKGFYDRFRNRIMFAIMDIRNRVIAFGGRVLDDSLPKYINSPETPIYKKGRHLYGANVAKPWCQKEKAVIVVEGYFDLLSLHAAGIKHVVASLGTALTPYQARLLKGLAPKVVMMYDGDAAGKKAAGRTLTVFLPLGIEPEVIILPEGDDPDSFIQREGPQAFGYLWSQKRTLFSWFLEEAERKSRNDLEQRMQILSELVNLITQVPNPLKQRRLSDQICEQFGIEKAVLEKIGRQSRLSPSSSEKSSVDWDRQIPLFEKKLLKFLLQNPEYLQQFSLTEINSEISHPISQKIFQKMSELYSQQTLTPEALLNELDENYRDLVTKWLLEPLPDNPEETAAGFRRLLNERKLKRLLQQIKAAEKTGNWEKLSCLLKQKYELAISIKRH